MIIALAAYAQKRVSGVVIDSKTGEPIPFASVGVIGTAKGTSTNAEGAFSILLSEADTLKITCIGYESQRFKPTEAALVIRLPQSVTKLAPVLVSRKKLDATDILKKAFKNVPVNFNARAFNQRFFYRHYCRDDSVYGRLIEAAVEVHKKNGYKVFRQAAGDREYIRVLQLRRSFDRTRLKERHVPISVSSILECDVAGYQMRKGRFRPSYLNGTISGLLKDAAKYKYTLAGITTYDGIEVFEIHYESVGDVARMGGMLFKLYYYARLSGKLFITTDTYAFVKTENTRIGQGDTLRTTAYYRPYGRYYYPYQLIQDGLTKDDNHWFHIEMMATEILEENPVAFPPQELSREALAQIPFDSTFWDTYNILKATQLEDKIIRDLGGEDSLKRQFATYRNVEDVTLNRQGDEQAFVQLLDSCRGKKLVYIDFWASWCGPCLAEFEDAKKLQQQYQDDIVFVMLSLDGHEDRWKNALAKYGLASGFHHFRIGPESSLSDLYDVTSIPRYVLLNKDGSHANLDAKRPSDPRLRKEFDRLLGKAAGK
ncbi:MAG: carboxypeptidase-like regulatory domain-containing protein [Cyclobacteriaceae bacterium]|nr:carboxypeptidase-like regulatory domain-containing protein [Cyclobacteriaceae bacterium]